MKNKDFRMELVTRRCGVEEYRVYDYEGMTEEQILDAVDPNNFGGFVRGNLVTVYTD